MGKHGNYSVEWTNIVALNFASERLQGHYDDCHECQSGNHCDVMRRWINNVKEAIKDVEGDYESR